MAFLQASLGWSTVSLSTGTAKTVATLKAASNQAIKILEISASHDGATSSNAPDVTQINRWDNSTTGTAGSTPTPTKKDPGRAETIQTTTGINYSAEPTVYTSYRNINLAQYNGLYHYICPLTAPLVVVGGKGIAITQNSPNNVNSTGHIEFEE